MKVLLMHRDRDFDAGQALPAQAAAMMQDLELESLLGAMTGKDDFLYGVARAAVLAGVTGDVDTILYRQAVLKDCLDHPDVILELYDLAVEARENRRKNWLGFMGHYPAGVLHSAVDLLRMLTSILRKLRIVAERESGCFASEGFRNLFAMLIRELDDGYLAEVERHLTALKFPAGMLASAELAEGNEGIRFVLRRPHGNEPTWLDRLLGKAPPSFSFRLHPRDEIGTRIVGELRERSINEVANAMGQSADHVQDFFDMLRTELAFYVGCLNLHRQLADKGEPVCFPQPSPAGSRRHRFDGLYDVCLTLHMVQRVTGNTADADAKSLVVVTGANQGGKSSFLRSTGLAQVMMQTGMFVGAKTFAAEVCAGLFTHYKREEDAAMVRGKFDEELARLSEIAGHLAPNAFLLCNESFASTNEREGSEIARHVVRALMEKGIKVFFVTHLYEFAHWCFENERETGLFLRAERLPDGTRTFRLEEGEPQDTSHGEDLYRSVFVTGEEWPVDRAASARV